MRIEFEDGSFMSIDRAKEGEYNISLCGKKADGSTTMSSIKLDMDQAIDLVNQFDEWLEIDEE